MDGQFGPEQPARLQCSEFVGRNNKMHQNMNLVCTKLSLHSYQICVKLNVIFINELLDSHRLGADSVVNDGLIMNICYTVFLEIAFNLKF